MQKIYLDHNATAPILPQVIDAVVGCYRAGHMNPASQHLFGQSARRVLEEARERIAFLLGADPVSDRLVFTSGGTEANNLAILGIANSTGGNVIISSIEHPSAVGAAQRLAQRGVEIRSTSVTPDGVVQPASVEKQIDEQTQLVSVMYGNNETGVVQPVVEIAEACRQRGVPFHTDAVQAVGKICVDFQKTGASAVSVSAHKFHGPRGIGALLLKSDTPIEAILFGGFQQGGIRPGTEAVAPAIGMCKSLELWHKEADERFTRMQNLRDRLEHTLLEAIPELRVNGISAERLPHTSNIAFPGRDRQALLMALDFVGLACSTGSACASGSSEPSPVLLAMGCPKAVVDGSLRFSLGATTTAAEIDEAARRIIHVAHEL